MQKAGQHFNILEVPHYVKASDLNHILRSTDLPGFNDSVNPLITLLFRVTFKQILSFCFIQKCFKYIKNSYSDTCSKKTKSKNIKRKIKILTHHRLQQKKTQHNSKGGAFRNSMQLVPSKHFICTFCRMSNMISMQYFRRCRGWDYREVDDLLCLPLRGTERMKNRCLLHYTD